MVFRDGSGAVGLLELHCAHRAASLEFGLIEEWGIRCCYHGWVYDVDGKILNTPGVEGNLKDRLYQGAFQVIEKYGLVFAYMGPPNKKPEFPATANFHLPGYQPAIPTVNVWPSEDSGDSWRRIERIFGEVIRVAWQPNSEDVQLKQTSSGTYAGFGGKVHTQDTREAHGLSG